MEQVLGSSVCAKTIKLQPSLLYTVASQGLEAEVAEELKVPDPKNENSEGDDGKRSNRDS